MKIENKTRFKLPEYITPTLHQLCREANIDPNTVVLIAKRRNRYIGKCWTKKGNTNRVSGSYKMDNKTIVIRLGRKSHMLDIKFVLAHEIGHLKQHQEVGELVTAGDYRTKYVKPEEYANKFALLTCNCYPKSNYRISKV